MAPRKVNLDPPTLLSAYASGVFPMTDPDGVTRWYSADPRGVLPLDQFHIPGTLRQLYRQKKFDIRVNTAFADVMRACGDVERPEADGSWIGDDLIAAYTQLHRLGFAHSVEAWQNHELVGGLYGVGLGGAFFGESMFHRVSNASKVCLVFLVERLRERGFTLLDTQMVTRHMKQFGATHIPASQYKKQLQIALELDRSFV